MIVNREKGKIVLTYYHIDIIIMNITKDALNNRLCGLPNDDIIYEKRNCRFIQLNSIDNQQQPTINKQQPTHIK